IVVTATVRYPGVVGWNPADPLAASPTYTLVITTPHEPGIIDRVANAFSIIEDMANRFAVRGQTLVENLIARIHDDSDRLFRTLKNGIEGALRSVFAALPDTLKSAFFGWLLGDPTRLASFHGFSSVEDVKAFLLEYSGLTWNNVQNVIRQQLGAGNYAAIERIVRLVQDDFQRDRPNGGVMEFLQWLPDRLRADGISVPDGLSWDSVGGQLFTLASNRLVALGTQAAGRLALRFVPGPTAIFTNLYQGFQTF